MRGRKRDLPSPIHSPSAHHSRAEPGPGRRLEPKQPQHGTRVSTHSRPPNLSLPCDTRNCWGRWPLPASLVPRVLLCCDLGFRPSFISALTLPTLTTPAWSSSWSETWLGWAVGVPMCLPQRLAATPSSSSPCQRQAHTHSPGGSGSWAPIIHLGDLGPVPGVQP